VKLKRNQIIFIVSLLLVLGAFGAVYQFYFKEKLETYNADRRFREQLEQAAKNLSGAFSGYRPDELIRLWRGQVQPWREALEDRSEFYNFGDWYEYDAPPEEGRILKVWYDEELDTKLDELYQNIYEKAPYARLPETTLLENFNVLDAQELDNQNRIDRNLIGEQLARFNFGYNMMDLLLDARISDVMEWNTWPRRTDPAHKNQLAL